jgi:iron complex transport system permease protein
LKNRALLLGLLLCLLMAAIILSLGYGKSLTALWRGLFENEGFGIILWKIRIPRTVIACLVGGSLAVSGVALQSVLQNPLAEPYTLGISGGASLGVTMCALLGLQRYLGIYANPFMGFVGAMFSVILVYLLSRRKLFNPTSMILFGIVVSLVFSSFVFFLFSIMDPDRMQITLMWIMGDLSSLDISLVPSYIPLFLVPAVLLLFFGKELDILSLGREKALYLGVNPQRMYKIIFFLTSLLAGLAVSASGIIGFVGLAVPHILRNLVGANHLFLLLSAYVGGAFFLVLSDVFARYLLYPLEMPVGVVTGMLGGMVLLLIMLRRR